jgi:DNA topoisomerase I
VRLRRSSPSAPGYSRHGRAPFAFRDQDGRPIESPETLERITALAIPPAWRHVWVCPYPNGHIQAAGVDRAGRRQYIYHESWIRQREAEKHRRIIAFGAALPESRQRVARALRTRTLSRDRVLASMFRILDVGALRIGNKRYAVENETFGLTTLTREHVCVDGRRVFFQYTAKGHVEQSHELRDAALARVVTELRATASRGEALFRWMADDIWHEVCSDDVNAFVREVTGGDFTAKDFRTLNATVLMAEELARAGPATSDAAQRRAIAAGYDAVADYLGNTRAVARGSYVDTRVVDRYLDGIVLPESVLGGRHDRPATRRRLEAAVLRLVT